MVSHVIDEFKFQQVIYEKKSLCLYNNVKWMLCLCGIRSQIFVTMEGEHSYGKETSAFYNNSTRTIQSLLCGAQYVTQVSLNYKLVYVVRLVYIYLPNCRLVYIYIYIQYQPAVCRCICVNIHLLLPLMYGYTIVVYIYI